MSCRVWGVDERRVGVPHAMATLMIEGAPLWAALHGREASRGPTKMRNGVRSARR